ncbi:hypothetical protein FRC98_02045 [Lujinxingia vulgaris]|uniref:Uncharacterized protein n=1 Tax=Lujinxingia vulgaris TaxID=2600176 RepID=A0A5C6XH56_9DELT|nr:hypothetical protein [Lujinxingia vulgaris]TXD39204.1 hypothetical protein FRC98_02045 [Lujinxingia vulgaris]
MTQAPDAEQQRGHLEKLRTCLQRGDAPNALALLRLVRLSGLNDAESAQLIRALSDAPSAADFQAATRWCETQLEALNAPTEASLFDDLDLLGDFDDLDDLVSMEDFEVEGAEMLQIDDIDEVGEDALDAFFDLDSGDDGGFFEHLNVADSQSEVDWSFDALDDDDSVASPDDAPAPSDAPPAQDFGEHTRRIDPSAALAQLGINPSKDAGESLRDNFTEHTRQFDPAQLHALHTSPEASAPHEEQSQGFAEPSFAGPNEPTGVSQSLSSSEDHVDKTSVAPSIESFFDQFDEPDDAGSPDAESEGYDFALGAALSVPFEESGEFEPEPPVDVDRTEVASAADYDFAMGASISTPIEDLLNEISEPSAAETSTPRSSGFDLDEPSDGDLKFSFDEPSSSEDDDFDLDFGFAAPATKGASEPEPALDFDFDAPAPPETSSRSPFASPSSTAGDSGFSQRPSTAPAREPVTAAQPADDLDFDFDLGPGATPAPAPSTPFQVADSVPGEVVEPEDDFFFPPPLNAQADSASQAPLVEPEDDFFFPPPLNAGTSAAAPGEMVEPEDDFFFPPPLNAAGSPASTAQDSAPVRDSIFDAPSSAERSAPRPEPPTARTPAPSSSAGSTQERPTGKMPSLERTRQRQDTPLAPQPNVAALKQAEPTPPRGTTPIPFAADAPSSGVISTKRDHVDEEEFFALADSLASESSMSSLFELSDHHRGPSHYRGEPVVREVGNEPTPAHAEPAPESPSPSSNPFAHDAPTGVRNRPLSEMAASSFVLEEVDGPPSEIPAEGANFDAITAQARRLYEKGEFETAHEIVSDVLNQTDHAEARQLRGVLEGEMERIQQDRLGSLVQVPTLKVSMGDIAGLDLDHRAGFLLSQIDGMLCFEDILDMSSMSRLETLTLLADLFDKGIIGVDPH